MGRTTNIITQSRTKTPNGVEIRKGKKGDASIRIVFQYRGVRCRETIRLPATAQNIKYAERLRHEIINAIERNNFNYTEYFPTSKRAKIFGHAVGGHKILVGDMLKEYLINAEKTLEKITFDNYKKSILTHLLPAFGHLPVSELKKVVLIRDFIKKLNRTIKTTNNVLIPLRAIINTAITDEILDSNPFDKIILTSLIDKEVRNSDYEPDPFDRAEIKEILESAEGQEKNLYQYSFFSGIRCPSELIILEWSDIDFDKKEVDINKAIVEKVIKPRTKTKQGKRKVPMLPLAYEALKSQFKYTGKDGGLVFLNPRTNARWLDDQQIRKTSWAHILKKSGVRYRSPYQMRHTFASMMLSKGENIMWLAKVLGHIDIEMIIKTYGKWIPESTMASGYNFVYDWSKYLEETKEG